MHFVTMTGGEYFFQPSIGALTKELGDRAEAGESLPPPKTPEPDHWDIDDPQADPCDGAEKG